MERLIIAFLFAICFVPASHAANYFFAEYPGCPNYTHELQCGLGGFSGDPSAVVQCELLCGAYNGSVGGHAPSFPRADNITSLGNGKFSTFKLLVLNSKRIWSISVSGNVNSITLVRVNYDGTDADNDNIGSIKDNCLTVSNSSQLNTDGDSQGDACDIDDDNDGVLDNIDAAPLNSVDTTEIILPLDGVYKGWALQNQSLKQ